ncbi:MAG: COX15/CtaA family protein, partial [Pseudomonadota bacterium]
LLSLKKMPVWILTTISITILSGALTAGSFAGYLFNDWPLMEGHFLPPSYLEKNIWQRFDIFKFLFIDLGTIQFHHRMMAYTTLLLAIIIRWKAQRQDFQIRKASALFLCAVLLQIIIGVVTLKKAVPLYLALLHQFGAAFMVICFVFYIITLRQHKS